MNTLVTIGLAVGYVTFVAWAWTVLRAAAIGDEIARRALDGRDPHRALDEMGDDASDWWPVPRPGGGWASSTPTQRRKTRDGRCDH